MLLVWQKLVPVKQVPLQYLYYRYCLVSVTSCIDRITHDTCNEFENQEPFVSLVLNKPRSQQHSHTDTAHY